MHADEYPGNSLGGIEVLPLCGDTVGVLYSPNRLGKCGWVCMCVANTNIMVNENFLNEWLEYQNP